MEGLVADVHTPDEGEIIRRVLAGEQNEFRHLVISHQQRVFQIILRQVGERSAASELAQDVFIKAFLHLRTFRGESSFSTWLIRIALNTTNSYFASAEFKRRAKTVRYEPQSHGPEEEGCSGDQVDKEECLRRLPVAIGLLKPRLREVVVLCSLQNYAYEEAAALLGIPVGTVRSRLHSARLKLKELVLQGSL